MKTKHMMRFFEADGGGNATGGTAGGAGDPPSLISSPASGTPAASAAGQAPATTGTPDAPWINPDGAFAEKWTEKLPSDLEGRESLARFKSVADLAKSYRNLETMVGKKTLVPTDKSTPEEVSAFRKAMGVPETLAEYDIKPGELPDGLGWNEDNAKRYAELGHKFNIPPAAMKAIVGEYANQRIQEMQAMAKEIDTRRQAGAADLKTTWGENFEKNLSIAKQAAQVAGVNPDSFGFGDPEVVKGFVRLAAQLSDDKLVSGGTGMQQGGAARAKDIQQNKANPLNAKYMDGDPDTVQMVRNLLQQG